MKFYSFLSFVICVLLCSASRSVRAQKNEAVTPRTYILNKITRVNYTFKESKSRIVTGSITKTGEKIWAETSTINGAAMFFDYVETERSATGIYISDSANNRHIFIDLASNTIQKKTKKGWDDYTITEVDDGTLVAKKTEISPSKEPQKKITKAPLAQNKPAVSVDVYLNNGEEFLTKKDENAAIKNFNAALDISPNSAEAYSGLGRAYQSKKEFDLAIENYSKAKSIETTRPDHLLDLASVYYEKGNIDSALFYCNGALILRPKFTDAYIVRAKYLSEKGRFDEAVFDYKKAISLDSSVRMNYINIIEPLVHLRQFDEAAAYYKLYLGQNSYGPIDGESWAFFKKYLNAIVENLTTKNYKGALVNLLAAEKLYNEKNGNVEDIQQNSFANILSLKGYVLEQMNNISEAQRAYSLALVINPRHTDAKDAIDRLDKMKEALEASDTSGPVISIIEPANKSFFFESGKTKGVQKIRGKAVDASGIRKLMINNKVITTEANGYFETIVDISAGTNVITIIAQDKNNNPGFESFVIEAGEVKSTASTDPLINIPDIDVPPEFHAILIAEKTYNDKKFPALPGTVSDMRKLYNVLTTQYNFDPKNVDTLVNASRIRILEKLTSTANRLNENASLFIFYAGHGIVVKSQNTNREQAYLIPSDAENESTSSYIKSSDLEEVLAGSAIKHILFTADACYAGGLFRGDITEASPSIKEKFKYKSRNFLSSGNKTVVPDKSSFIESFYLALLENKDKYITAESLIYRFKTDYFNKTSLYPQYNAIHGVEHEGGDFVFFHK